MKPYVIPSQKITAVNESLTTLNDEDFEEMISERLSCLDELSRSEFYRNRSLDDKIDLLPTKDRDLLILEAMERSYKHETE